MPKSPNQVKKQSKKKTTYTYPGNDGTKYKATGIWDGDDYFASKKEFTRWKELKLLEKAKLIKDLKRQVRFKLVVNGVLIATYVCDAQYVDCATGKSIVEDTKSAITKKLLPYVYKKKLMKALFGIEILET